MKDECVLASTDGNEQRHFMLGTGDIWGLG